MTKYCIEFMPLSLPRSEERIGLILAILAHGGLLAWLLFKPAAPALPPIPPAMEVTISDDVGLTSSAPAPAPAAAPAPEQAPLLGDVPGPKPEPKLEPKLEPKPAPKPAPKPMPVAKIPTPQAKPIAIASPKPVQKAAPTKPAGASKIGNDFLRGVAAAPAKGTAQTAPAATIGPAVKSSLAAAISRQLKPRWDPPEGADAEQLATVLAWNLNRDGSLAGDPSVVRQEGITDANRPQARRHAEQAIRAVKLAAPFQLPPEYYDAWKRVAAFRFDRNLAQ